MFKRLALFVMLICLTLFLTSPAYAVRYNELAIGTVSLHGNSAGATQALMEDAVGKILMGSGITVPADGTGGYAVGGMFIDTDAVNAMRAIYENQGTTTSSAFKLVGGEEHILAATYDFAVEGGTHNSSYGLGVSLPDNAVVTRSWYEVLTTFQSSGDIAAMALDIPTDDAAGLVAFTAISTTGDIWDAGYHEGIQVGTAATFAEKTTAEREVTFSLLISEDLTAGKATFRPHRLLSRHSMQSHNSGHAEPAYLPGPSGRPTYRSRRRPRQGRWHTAARQQK